jgi:starch synthase
MRYGCVPVARATGGLRDTITDERMSENPTGFLFSEATPEALAKAIHRTLTAFAQPPHWQALQRNGMVMDFSVEKSALQYASLYRNLVSAPQSKTEVSQKEPYRNE